MEDKKNMSQESKRDSGSSIENKPNSDKRISLLVAIFLFAVILFAAYWFLSEEKNSEKYVTDVSGNTVTKSEETGWSTFISSDQYFRMDFPNDWERVEDTTSVFSALKYNDAQEVVASLNLRTIDANGRIELQEVLDNQYEACLDSGSDCSEMIVEDMQLIKVSGVVSRIDSSEKYQSGTTIYIYLQDYYYALHIEYFDEALASTIKKIVDSIYIEYESKFNFYYCNREPGVVAIDNYMSGYCYKVKEGDTLWSIAENYYGVPELWTQLKLHDADDPHDLSKLSPDDPRALEPGTELVLWNALQFSSSYNERTAGGIGNGWGLDTDTGDLFTASDGNIYINKDIYDSGFSSIFRFLVDERTNNKVYVISPTFETGEARQSGPSGWKFQFVFNKQRNPYVGPGATFELLTFNHDEDRYALRTNVRQGVDDPGFMVLSNIGNGPEYDYLDSIIWYDNDTLVYRAQNDDQWRLVVNNQDYEIYDYLENLRVEDGVLKFEYRKDNGSWSSEGVSLDGESYNAELAHISDEAPVGDEFFAYLKSTRSDLSEAELFRIEKEYHYKKGKLVDQFGDPVTDPVEIYLDPVPGLSGTEDPKRLSFTTKNGSFELFVPKIGVYTMSLEDGWSADSLDDINPVDFRYREKDPVWKTRDKEYEITVSNEEYNQKVREKHSQAAEEGDTLWSFAARNYGQGYLWPIIAENNNLYSASENTLLTEGNLYFIVPFEELHFDEIFELRKKYHDENVEPLHTLSNAPYSYSVDYPDCWEPKETTTLGGSSYIHKQVISGPRSAVNPRGKRQPSLSITIYNNEEGLSPADFAASKGFLDHVDLENEKFSYEVLDSGAVLFKYGGSLVYGSSGLAEIRHQLFVNDNMIYDIAYSVHHSIDDVAEEEIQDMIASFRITD